MNTPSNLNENWENVGTFSQLVQVINPPRTLTGFIVSEPGTKDNRRRAEVLAATYRYILGTAWGKQP